MIIRIISKFNKGELSSRIQVTENSRSRFLKKRTVTALKRRKELWKANEILAYIILIQRFLKRKKYDEKNHIIFEELMISSAVLGV